MSVVNVGTTPNDGTGDDLRTAFTNINAMFDEIADVRVKFGVVADDSTDDTAAMQAAFDWMLTTGTAGRALKLPGTPIRISSALTVSGTNVGWRLIGDSRGSSIIRQATDNTPIISITGNTSWGWAITDIAFDWVNAQPSTNTNAIGIYFDGTTASQQAFHWYMDRVTFDKGYLAIASNSAKSLSIWGFEIGQMLVNSSMSGGAMRLLPSPALGQPSIKIRQLYTRCDAMTLPVVAIAAANGLRIDSLEANILTNIPILRAISGCSGKVGMLKIEVGNYTAADTKALEYSDSQIEIDDFIVGQVTCNVGAGNKWHVNRVAGGASSHLHIHRLSANVTLTSGKAYVQSASGDANSVVIDKFGNYAGIELTDTSTTNGADNLIVSDWARQRVSTDNGDNDKTLVMGDATIQRWGTTLTGNKTVMLPVRSTATGACNVFNGASFRILRDAATPGAFTLTILNDSGATMYTIPINTKQSVLLVWDRTSGGAWRVADVATL